MTSFSYRIFLWTCQKQLTTLLTTAEINCRLSDDAFKIGHCLGDWKENFVHQWRCWTAWNRQKSFFLKMKGIVKTPKRIRFLSPVEGNGWIDLQNISHRDQGSSGRRCHHRPGSVKPSIPSLKSSRDREFENPGRRGRPTSCGGLIVALVIILWCWWQSWSDVGCRVGDFMRVLRCSWQNH